MQDINELVTKNFNDNIEYIEKNHPKLFKKLSDYDAAVTNGHYVEKYELVYENDNFDVLEKSTHRYLYNKQTTQHSKEALKSVNNALDNNIFEGFIRNSYDNETAKFHTEKENLDSHLNFTAQIINYIQQFPQPSNTKIDKYIFFGVGLGIHIEAIIEKIGPEIILFVEDDLELFRLSLLCINYANIASQKELYFSIFQTQEEFTTTTETFLNNKYYLNHYIKHFHLLSHNEEKSNLFYLSLTDQPHLRFLFSDMACNYIDSVKQLSKHYSVIKNSIDISSLNLPPFLLLASGPSLQKHIEWVKKNQQYFTIVAVSSALSYLQKHKINVDIITHLDPFEASINSFKRVENLNHYSNALKLFSISSPDIILDMWDNQSLFVFETGTSYYNNSLKISSPCIGSWTLLMLLALGVKEIYLLGLDLAIDTKTGQNHIDDHQDNETLHIENNSLNSNTLQYKNSTFPIQGNFHKTVYTTPHYYGSIKIINRYFPQIQKKDQNIYNLSNGAQFYIAKPTDPQTLSFKQTPQKNITLLKQVLQSHSQINFLNSDLETLRNKLCHAKTIKNSIETFQLTQETTPNDYMEQIISITANHEDTYLYELSRILEDYLKYITHYIYIFMCSFPNERISIDKIFRYNIIKLINIYIQSLEIVLNKG